MTCIFKLCCQWRFVFLFTDSDAGMIRTHFSVLNYIQTVLGMLILLHFIFIRKVTYVGKFWCLLGQNWIWIWSAWNKCGWTLLTSINQFINQDNANIEPVLRHNAMIQFIEIIAFFTIVICKTISNEADGCQALFE